MQVKRENVKRAPEPRVRYVLRLYVLLAAFRAAFLSLLACLGVSCESAYDVTASMSDGAVRLIGLPGRPAPQGPFTATIAIAGASVVAKPDGTADLLFPNGRRLPLIARRGVAPFPADLQTPPTDQTVPTQALSAQLFLGRLLDPLPAVLRTAIEQGEPATRSNALAVARKMLSSDRIAISGRVGRWWRFAGYYRLIPADRERLAAAIGTLAPESQP